MPFFSTKYFGTYPGVEGDQQQLACRRTGLRPELGVEIGRGPEQEEPPDAVGDEFSEDYAPGLAVFQAFPQGDALLGGQGGPLDLFRGVVLVDIFKFLRVDPLAFLRLVVKEHPEEHPDETDGADYDEGHLPAVVLGKDRDAERGGQGAHGSPGIEYGGGESPVLLREILRRDLDGGREVACFSEGQHAPTEHEQIDGSS